MRELQKKPKGEAPDEGEESDDDFRYVSTAANLAGVARSQRAFLEECRRILMSKDILVEMMLIRGECHEAIRLKVWRTIGATSAYLGGKNLLYATNECLKNAPSECNANLAFHFLWVFFACIGW